MSKLLFPGLLLSAAVVVPATLRAAEPQPVGTPRLLITDRDTGLPISGAVVRHSGHLWRSDEAGLLLLNENALGGDSLTVSAVGYVDRHIATDEVRSHRPPARSAQRAHQSAQRGRGADRTHRPLEQYRHATLSAAEVQKNSR